MSNHNCRKCRINLAKVTRYFRPEPHVEIMLSLVKARRLTSNETGRITLIDKLISSQWSEQTGSGGEVGASLCPLARVQFSYNQMTRRARAWAGNAGGEIPPLGLTEAAFVGVVVFILRDFISISALRKLKRRKHFGEGSNPLSTRRPRVTWTHPTAVSRSFYLISLLVFASLRYSRRSFANFSQRAKGTRKFSLLLAGKNVFRNCFYTRAGSSSLARQGAPTNGWHYRCVIRRGEC